ncbi:chaoptin isoform X2 [Contarinia nasturtii]|uniref:chaoptin isoform X2 n=1 Tax=Contarinia nasturtii TaxID=265458 RepID=UPI0012D48F8B|nr:chaoptin isoform X2 [Contarinia nasturtii]
MNQVDALIRFGYALVIVTMLLMIWASLAGARELENNKHPPCLFSPLCTCSKASQNDLGIIECKNVPYPAIPRTLNYSKVFMLHMERTGLQNIPPSFLLGTGLYRIEISHNPLGEVLEGVFDGLERSLWELSLHHNQLVEVPTRAIRNLKKLKYLDLSANQIDCIEIDSFFGLEASLERLILADNAIDSLPRNAFSSLPKLDTIDLSGNNIAYLEPNIFDDGMPSLAKLFLSNNALVELPYNALATLKNLRVLDLSHNLINSIRTENDAITSKLTLDMLHLEFNRIEEIPTASFSHIDVVNVTYLDGNPLTTLGERAFESARIRELYIRHCGLNLISPASFDGLKTLQILDISGNNLTALAKDFLQGFTEFRALNIKDNKLKDIQTNEVFAAIQSTIEKLDMSGEGNVPTSLKNFSIMKSIRSLSLGKLTSSQLSPDDFADFGVELEDLKLAHSSIDTIKSHAFKNARGIRRLDLSENIISTIENDAFTEIGHSLISLKISHGFAGSFTSFPAQSFRTLTSLQELDLSNNQLKSISDTSFHFLQNLRTVELNDNVIERISKGTFQGDIHSKLETLALHFNSIKAIEESTFADLKELTKLQLDDNRITTIEKRAFIDLKKLKYLSLRGNKLEIISDEAFQNLPELQHLDLAYNSMGIFDFNICDQVGTLSSLRVNASHNRISELSLNHLNSSASGRPEAGNPYHSNIKVLDLSHNVITGISVHFFRPAEKSLTHLNLAHNQLTNTTRDVFGYMPLLHWLDLSHNRIIELDFDSFFGSKKLQVLDLSHNSISELPQTIFKTNNDLRIVNLSHNNLRTLSDNLFSGGGVESLDLSHNLLTKIPSMSLTNVAVLALCNLDLSHNGIVAIHSIDLSNKFRALTTLDLSNNRIFQLDDAAFTTLPHLAYLDLSNNNELIIMDKAFLGLEDCLFTLTLNNVSLTSVPELALPSLRALHLSRNSLPFIPQELAYNLSSLRSLDVSGNDLTAVPSVIHSLPKLRSLSLGSNPIQALKNNTFRGLLDKIEHLDISSLHLNLFENGALGKSSSLRSLQISPYLNIADFNIPTIVSQLLNLQKLCISAPEPQKITTGPKVTYKSVTATDLRKEMTGRLPLKLREIMISGEGFTSISDTILNGVQSKSLHLQLFNTSITSIPENAYRQLGRVQNISIDVSNNNKALTKQFNPNTAQRPLEAELVYLTDLKIAGNTLSCDCDVGWLEYWYRKQRQYVCRAQTWTEDVFGSPIHSPVHSSTNKRSATSCNTDENRFENELREVTCSNKQSQQLIEVLKSDLECGWNGASSFTINASMFEIIMCAICCAIVGVWI